MFAKSGGTEHTSWHMVAFAFAILLMFWVAIWILDFCYYDRLLIGSAEALAKLEEASKTEVRIKHLSVSTDIRDAIVKLPSPESNRPNLIHVVGFSTPSCSLLLRAA